MAETTTTIVSPKNLEDGLKAVYNEIPAVSTTIDSTSTNNSVPTSKAAYDAIEAAKVTIDTTITTSATDDHVPSSKAVKAYVDSIPRFDKRIVDALPATGEDNVIYLIPNTLSENQNAKIEYMWINGDWEVVGSTTVDLSDYQKKPSDSEQYILTTITSPITPRPANKNSAAILIPCIDKNGNEASGSPAEFNLQLAASDRAGIITGDMFDKIQSLSPITPMTDAEVTAMINRVKGVST